MISKSTPIAVTGAAGLAGSAVVARLRDTGYTNVLPITRKLCDLTDPSATHFVFEQFKPQVVFHAAATVYGIGGNMKNQGKSFYNNTMVNTNVIEASRRAGVSKIVVMGTNAIYPDPPVLPYKENGIFNGRPHAAESAYGHSKRGMLAMLEAYRESYGLEYAYLVSGNLYGPGDTFDIENGHVLPTMVAKFAEALKTGGDVNLWGDGSAKRDFLFSKDLARVAEMTMFGSTTGPINVGSGSIVSIREVANVLCVISGVSEDRVIFDTSKPNGRLDCTSDLTRLRGIGFKPVYSLPEGLRQTWSWYRKNVRQ